MVRLAVQPVHDKECMITADTLSGQRAWQLTDDGFPGCNTTVLA